MKLVFLSTKKIVNNEIHMYIYIPKKMKKLTNTNDFLVLFKYFCHVICINDFVFVFFFGSRIIV